MQQQAKVQRRIEEGKGKDEEEFGRHDAEDDVKEEEVKTQSESHPHNHSHTHSHHHQQQEMTSQKAVIKSLPAPADGSFIVWDGFRLPSSHPPPFPCTLSASGVRLRSHLLELQLCNTSEILSPAWSRREGKGESRYWSKKGSGGILWCEPLFWRWGEVFDSSGGEVWARWFNRVQSTTNIMGETNPYLMLLLSRASRERKKPRNATLKMRKMRGTVMSRTPVFCWEQFFIENSFLSKTKELFSLFALFSRLVSSDD